MFVSICFILLFLTGNLMVDFFYSNCKTTDRKCRKQIHVCIYEIFDIKSITSYLIKHCKTSDIVVKRHSSI